MPTSTLDVAEAQVRLSELIHEANEGEDVVIANDDGTAVRLVPVEPQGRLRFGSARGMFTMSDDFEAPLEDPAAHSRNLHMANAHRLSSNSGLKRDGDGKAQVRWHVLPRQ